MPFTQIPFQRIDTDEFGRITTEVYNPQYDEKGNYASGQIKLHDRLWPVTITDVWEEDRRVWRHVATDEYISHVNAKMRKALGYGGCSVEVVN